MKKRDLTRNPLLALPALPALLALLVSFALLVPPALADHQPSDAKKDKRESSKAALKLQRAVAEKCDGPKKHRGSEFQAVMKEINAYCGHDLSAGCSISGKGHAFVLRKLTDKKNRISKTHKNYPDDFEKVLTKNCSDR